MISLISGSSSLTQSYMAQMRQQMFNKIDTDGDGKHSREEISAMIANGPQGGASVDEIFSRADTDGDGYISQAEFEADSPPDRQMQGSGFGGMGSVSSADFLQQMFNKIDTDGDGKHSREEISAMIANGPQGGASVDEIFDRADTNKDGYISQAEFEADQTSMQQNGTGQAESTQSGSNAQDTLFTKLLEALENETTATSSNSGNAAQLLSAAIQSYMQSSTNNYSQSNMQSLLGSSLYV
jgi:Ca2+-binding EF-hand superfamily protein